jgi:hypothetical protein
MERGDREESVKKNLKNERHKKVYCLNKKRGMKNSKLFWMNERERMKKWNEIIE